MHSKSPLQSICLTEDGIMKDFGDFKVRAFRSTESDITSLSESANHDRVRFFLSSRFPKNYTNSAALNYISLGLMENPSHFAIADSKDRVIGALDVRHNDDMWSPRKEIGYWITPDFWGKGIMTQVVRWFSSYLFYKYPDLQVIQIKVADGNEGSAAVARKAGYQLEGIMRNSLRLRDGTLTSELTFGLLREEDQKLVTQEDIASWINERTS